MIDVAFAQTDRALVEDSPRASVVGILLAGTLLALWVLWFFAGKVAVYRVSEGARLETGGAAHPIEAPVAGRVMVANLSLGDEVHRGDILVKLDSEAQKRQLEEERTHLASLGPQIGALTGAVAAQQKALIETEQADLTALDEARARLQGADNALSFAQHKAEIYSEAKTALPKIEVLRAAADFDQRKAEAEADRLEVTRLQREQLSSQTDREAHLEELRRDLAQLEGESKIAGATIKRLEYEIENRRVRSPVSGRIGEVGSVNVGEFVSEGERLAAVVAPGQALAVAYFNPAEAVGRVRAGQPALLRLDGFPWTQYGSLRAVVTAVASEAREGRIRVELALNPNSAPRIPLQHGLTGTVQIEVEHVAPATIVWRSVGQLLTRPSGP